MIYRLKLGNPIETDAVIDLEGVENRDEVQFLELLGNVGADLFIGKASDEDDSAALCVKYKMGEDAVVFGLGESMRGINKRGFKYVSDNTDEPDQKEDKLSLYGAHNFVVVRDDEDEFGLFFDYPGKMEFDIGFAKRDEISITAGEKDMYIYLITDCSLYGIVKQFRRIIGPSYIPPFWAFGYGQSRYGYMNADEIRNVVNGYRNNGIPLDMVYMDIDYMQDYKDFTVNEERFPNFPDFVEEIKEQGVRLVPIIDAAIKNEEGYAPYDEAKAKGYFCTNDDNSLFSIGVWPGWCNVPDFMKPEVRAWWGDQYKVLTDAGIEGFWNDMNEPAIFYTGWSFGDTVDLFNRLAAMEGEPKPADFYKLSDSINAWRSHDQYKNFYHIMDGKRIRHDKVHNLYGYNMTRGAAEGLEKQLEGRRGLLFSRSSYIGMHRYGGVWTGDNASWWSHLLMNIQQLPGLNMCGFLYSGADTGGFNGDVTEDLLLRWIGLSIFTPLFRNHTTWGSRNQECYRFDAIESFREIIKLRYRLIPYLYSEFLKCVENNEMFFRPLGFDYEYDDEALNVDDQLLLGEGLMIAPVYKQNATGRYVYLPEDMLYVKFKSSTEYTVELMPKGHHHIDVALSEIPLFVRKDKLLPLGDAQICTDDMRRYFEGGRTGELDCHDFEIISFPSEEGSPKPRYEMYTETDRQIYKSMIFEEEGNIASET